MQAEVLRRRFAVPRRVAAFFPVVVVLVGLVLLMYPLALLFGLPLALRDMRDLRKWDKATVTAQPPQELGDTATLTFAAAVKSGVLIRGETPLDVAYTQAGERVTLDAAESPLVTWGKTLTPVSKTRYRYPGDLPDPLTLYVGNTLAAGGATSAAETPDDVRTTFTFGGASGPVLLDDEVLTEGKDYAVQGNAVTFTEAPSFGSDLRRVSGDYAVLDGGERTVVFTVPPTGVVRAVKSVVRLAERLMGEANGTNRVFTFSQTPVVETEPYDVYVDTIPLSSDDERPDERVDGEQATFTFDSSAGIVAVDGAPQTEGKDYTRDGPRRNIYRTACS